MPERGRDRAVDALLRRVLSDDACTPPQAPCVDGETLGAWLSGSLRAEEATAVERHVADCGRCRTLAAMFIQSAPAEPGRESTWTRWRLGWVVPLATAATAAALWVALPGNTTADRPQGSAAKMASGHEAPAPNMPPAPAPAASAPSAPAPPSLRETARLNEQAPPRAGAAATAGTRADEPARREVADQQASAPAQAARTELEKPESADSAPQAFAARQAAAPPPEISAPGGAARWRILGQRVEWTRSGGSSWEPAAITSDDALTAGAAPASAVCWIVGRRGAVYLATDGASFMRLPFPEIVDLVSVMATDDRHATVAAADGRSWQTSDQGLTWSMGR